MLVIAVVLVGFLVYWFGIRGCGSEPGDEEVLTPIYVTIYSHNEDSWEPLVDTLDEYQFYRENLLERLHLIDSYGATLNWQSDWVVLEAMLRYENGEILDSTNGKNIVEYMVEDLGFSADPHGHLVEYNYADLAKLISDLGVEPSGVVGGCLYVECGKEPLVLYLDWHDIIELDPDGFITGRIYPDYRWRPTILAQPAQQGHYFDDFSSGVWKPGNGDDFYGHSEDNPLVYVGEGYPHDAVLLGPYMSSGARVEYREAGYIKELVAKIRSGELPADRIYTASIHVRDLPVVAETGVPENEALESLLKELEPYVERGCVIYADYEEAADIWAVNYDGVPNTVKIEDFSAYPNILEDFKEFCKGF